MLNYAAGSSVVGYNLTRSLRFRASANGYLGRTPASAGNRQIWTYSIWVKKSQILADSTDQPLLHAYAGSGASVQTGIQYSSYSPSGIIDSIRIQSGTQGVSQDFDFAFANTYRDPSAWYHIVVAFDTTQATAANRIKVYVNGNQLGSPVSYAGRATTVSQNYQTAINSNISHHIGVQVGGTQYFDGYLAEVNFIDGQALTPSSFGSTNALTGVWQPAAYTGTYGTNGFYLPFTDNSTAAALGTDFSGNSNTWTVNNISVTAGVTYDSMTDVPTLTSATAANYCVMNPLDKNANIAVTNGNLTGTYTGNAALGIRGSIALPSTGKYYWEYQFTGGVPFGSAGVASPTASLSSLSGTFVIYSESGDKYVNSASSSAYGASYTTGDIIGVAHDADANTITFYKNNISQGAISLTASTQYFPFFNIYNAAMTATFGQRPFAYTPPSGFVALNTFNLPASTIVDGSNYMDAALYTGDGNLTRTLTGLYEFQPDFIWAKNRSGAFAHVLQDSVRGFSSTTKLSSNTTDPENSSGNATDPGFGYISGVSSTGFSVATTGGGITQLNQGTAPYVAWGWQANGAAVSNTDGTITSQVSVNASAGFSVMTYTGTGANATVGHGLGVAPSLIIVKRRDTTSNWNVYHTSVGATGVLLLNTTDSTTTSSLPWNNTAPTSSVFTVGTGNDVNASGGTFVAYCWTAISGFSAMGSYVGNANADGPFVFTGFRPNFVLIKRSTGLSDLGNWILLDTARNTYNVSTNRLFPNTSNAENGLGGSGDYIDILSNGFKVRGSGGWVNQSGSTMVYICFAENPFKFSLAR
jgi:hypothetical protein